MDMNTLTAWVRQNAVIESNSEYACVAVDFSNVITEWHDPMELAYFVAELFPLRDWQSVGVSPGEEDFQVSTWWCSDEYADACQEKFDNKQELPLTPEGRKKLADWVKNAMQFPVEESPEDFYVVMPDNFFALLGEKAVINFIVEQFSGYDFLKMEGYPLEDHSSVVLTKTSPVKIAA